MAPLQALSLLLLASLASSAASGYRSTLTHIDSKLGFTKAQLMRRAVHRSRLRAASMLPGYSTTLSSSNAGPRLRSGQAEYLMELAIGTPPVPFVALADTGSDLTWTQCQPCKLCFPQDTPVYDPTTSSSFSPVPCSSATCLSIWSRNCTPTALCRYRYGYEDGAYSAGGLGTETITFGSSAPGEAPAASAGGVAFGCGTDNGGDSYNSTGTVGLGRGSLSLVAQLGVGKFSYCLTDFFNTSLGSPLPAMPDMVLHFAGGADMTLHRDNYMSSDEEDSSFCLNIAGATSTSTSVLGNFQQQNIQMLFDITVGQMSFVPTDCSKL
uniref:Aspartic proteinase nepenthesin-1 n=1 Tax=Aegilops tauschii TaxID=37682 RepID=M8ASF6_AEGTA